MVFVNSNAIFIDFEAAELLGKAMEPVKRLIIQMQDIWERYMDDVGQSDWDMLGVHFTRV